MTRRAQLKKELLATICEHLRDAKFQWGSEGRWSPWDEVKIAFPTIPDPVRTEAVIEFESEELDAWWAALERTIDGEVLRRAIAPKAREG